jgi:hypothetical protein
VRGMAVWSMTPIKVAHVNTSLANCLWLFCNLVYLNQSK